MKLVLTLVLLIAVVNSQTINNIRLVGHAQYMINVLQEVIAEVERREWCNLKVPDITSYINETVIDRDYSGSVTYSNGFLASLQQVDIRQQGVDQVWSWNKTEGTGSVLTRATIRLHDVSLGYDVVADMQDGHHRYTVTVTYPLVLFSFNINRYIITDEVNVEVVGTISATANVNTIKFLPKDDTTDVLATMFLISLPEDGIKAWSEVFGPIAHHVASEVVEFPRVCYDCPATAT